MYLISAYFDNESEKIIQKHIDAIAAKTGCSYIKDNNIPPHITLAEYIPEKGKDNICAVMQQMDKAVDCKRVAGGTIDIVSFGVFKPRVMFLTPVLNKYLHQLCAEMNSAAGNVFSSEHDFKKVSSIGDLTSQTLENSRCLPFSWLPHITVARGLNEQQMQRAFSCMQANFNVFSARIEKIGLAVSKPHRDIKIWNL